MNVLDPGREEQGTFGFRAKGFGRLSRRCAQHRAREGRLEASNWMPGSIVDMVRMGGSGFEGSVRMTCLPMALQ